jgi:hypothetical protein
MIDDEDLQTLTGKQQQAVMGNPYNSYKIWAITQLILIFIPPC